jgi:hypothetical protein
MNNKIIYLLGSLGLVVVSDVDGELGFVESSFLCFCVNILIFSKMLYSSNGDFLLLFSFSSIIVNGSLLLSKPKLDSRRLRNLLFRFKLKLLTIPDRPDVSVDDEDNEKKFSVFVNGDSVDGDLAVLSSLNGFIRLKLCRTDEAIDFGE